MPARGSSCPPAVGQLRHESSLLRHKRGSLLPQSTLILAGPQMRGVRNLSRDQSSGPSKEPGATELATAPAAHEKRNQDSLVPLVVTGRHLSYQLS